MSENTTDNSQQNKGEATEQKLKSISDLGEFGLIKEITKSFEIVNKSTELGIGDDAAVLSHDGMRTVVTTDLLTEGVHFDLSYAPLKHLGYKAVAVNVSDLYAMNAQPEQITVSIAVSSRFSVEAIEELYLGIRVACQNYGVDLIGGDTSSSLSGMMISVTAIGTADSDKIVKRSTAQPNDLICVTGDLGAAYAGLQLLEREKKIFQDTGAQPQLDGWDYVLERQLKPEARKDAFEFFAEKELVPTSMIDISDGLSSELLHIATESGVGVKVFEEKLPIHPETESMVKEFNLDTTTFAMNGGEDYELLFTIKPEQYDIVKDNEAISVIGHITETKENVLIARDGTPVPVMAQGWNHAQNEG